MNINQNNLAGLMNQTKNLNQEILSSGMMSPQLAQPPVISSQQDFDQMKLLLQSLQQSQQAPVAATKDKQPARDSPSKWSQRSKGKKNNFQSRSFVG